ncbi:hypothetical protein TNCV_3320761 [Trichonephila clavipes]|nr:hypothetical protein TNCV_3320761 [Trichonephila clavipes]
MKMKDNAGTFVFTAFRKRQLKLQLQVLTVIIKSEVSRLRQQSSALYLELRCSLCWNFVGGVGVTSREIQYDWLKPVSVVWL